MHLVDTPWEQMTPGERVRFLLGSRCSALEIAVATGLPATEIQGLAAQLMPPPEPEFAPGGKRGFTPDPFDR
jgi:hypothetical protein